MEMENKQMMPFAFGDNLVRVFEDENGNPWFVAKDVCRILELGNVSKSCAGLDEDEKGITNCYTPGGEQEMLTISESGLYALVFRSRKPEAKAFSKWVRSEVLPAIRKTGRYEKSSAKQRNKTPDELPEEALNIPPRMRQRLWQDAIQTARLDGGGSNEAREWFLWLCRMNGFGRPRDGNAGIWNFMDDCLEQAKGQTTPFHKIHALFIKWWRDNGYGEAPGCRTLSEYVALRYQKAKSSVIVFRNCRIREGVEL